MNKERTELNKELKVIDFYCKKCKKSRLTDIGRDLPNRLWSHTAQINTCSGGGVRYGTEKSLLNR